MKKFSLLSVSFRSVLDRKIVIFGLIQAVTLVSLNFMALNYLWYEKLPGKYGKITGELRPEMAPMLATINLEIDNCQIP